MSILYRYGSTWYINMTNRCPCKCTFCVRNHVRKLGDADDLWLAHEPTAEDVMTEIRARALDANQIVFCGYGEPTERLDSLFAICDFVKSDPNLKGRLKTRLNTNGLSDFINERATAKEFEGRLDAVSISLNAPTAEKYNELCRPKFGLASFDEILRFTEEIKQYVPDVTMSVVGFSIPQPDIEDCRKIAEKLSVKFRVR